MAGICDKCGKTDVQLTAEVSRVLSNRTEHRFVCSDWRNCQEGDVKEAPDLRSELRDLLDRYNVSIAFDCGEGSDLHGVYGEVVEVVDNATDKAVISADGWSICADDLKD